MYHKSLELQGVRLAFMEIAKKFLAFDFSSLQAVNFKALHVAHLFFLALAKRLVGHQTSGDVGKRRPEKRRYRHFRPKNNNLIVEYEDL